MDSETTAKKDIYKAIGYVALLVGLSFPASILGIKILNFVLGNLT